MTLTEKATANYDSLLRKLSGKQEPANMQITQQISQQISQLGRSVKCIIVNNWYYENYYIIKTI